MPCSTQYCAPPPLLALLAAAARAGHSRRATGAVNGAYQHALFFCAVACLHRAAHSPFPCTALARSPVSSLPTELGTACAYQETFLSSGDGQGRQRRGGTNGGSGGGRPSTSRRPRPARAGPAPAPAHHPGYWLQQPERWVLGAAGAKVTRRLTLLSPPCPSSARHQRAGNIANHLTVLEPAAPISLHSCGSIPPPPSHPPPHSPRRAQASWMSWQRSTASATR